MKRINARRKVTLSRLRERARVRASLASASTSRTPPSAAAIAGIPLRHAALAARWKARPVRRPDRRRPPGRRLQRPPSRSRQPARARRLRHQRPPGCSRGRRLQRGAHPGDHAGDLRAPGARRHHRAALSRRGHARGVGARAAHGARGARRERRRDAGPGRRPVHADPGAVARDHLVQRHARARRRRGNAGLADGIVITPSHNPPARRRLQVQPAPRRPRRQRHHERRRGARQRAARATAGDIRRVPYERAPHRARHPRLRLPHALRGGPAEGRRHRRDRARAASSWGPTRWAAPACSTGRAIAEHFHLDLHGRQQGRRSAVRVHDAGPRRQDPDGLLQPVRDGQPARAARTASPSPSATTRTPTATASSRRRRA